MQRMPVQNADQRGESATTTNKANGTSVAEFNYLLNLKTAKFRLYFEAQQEIYLPKYKGATFRGVFGNVFKKVARELGFSHIYDYIFETPNDGRLPGYVSRFAPKPFVLEAPLTNKKIYKTGENFELDFILIGKAINYIPPLIYIFDEAGRSHGIGKWRSSGFGNYALKKVTFLNDQSETLFYQPAKMLPFNGITLSYPEASPKNDQDRTLLLVNFITPTHIIRNHSAIEKNPDNPLTFEVFIRSLYRRVYYLYYFHQNEEIPPFNENIPVPNLETLSKSLIWERIHHFSNRQKRRVPLAGFRGSVVFNDGWQPYWSLLKLGEILHIGKETTFGFGKYHLSTSVSG